MEAFTAAGSALSSLTSAHSGKQMETTQSPADMASVDASVILLMRSLFTAISSDRSDHRLVAAVMMRLAARKVSSVAHSHDARSRVAAVMLERRTG